MQDTACLPFVALEHEIPALDPGGASGGIFGAGAPERLPTWPHQDQRRGGVAGLAAPGGQVLAIVGEAALSFD
jgi:hypothetical protein